MGADVGPLLDLQQADSETDRLRARLASLPEQAEVDDLAAELRRGDAVLAQASAEATEARRAQDRIEAQLASQEAKASSVTDRLYGRSGVVSSPKELQALQADLDMIKRQISETEDAVLAAMEARDDAADLEKKTMEAVAQLRERLVRARETLTVITRDLEAELALAGERSAVLRPGVPAQVLALYDRIREQSQDGVAAAVLRDGICGACTLRLPSAEWEAARYATGIVRCEACRRILVIV